VTKVYAELKNQPTVLRSRQEALKSLNFEWVTLVGAYVNASWTAVHKVFLAFVPE
jgi:hypothetical protein